MTKQGGQQQSYFLGNWMNYGVTSPEKEEGSGTGGEEQIKKQIHSRRTSYMVRGFVALLKKEI